EWLQDCVGIRKIEAMARLPELVGATVRRVDAEKAERASRCRLRTRGRAGHLAGCDAGRAQRQEKRSSIHQPHGDCTSRKTKSSLRTNAMRSSNRSPC